MTVDQRMKRLIYSERVPGQRGVQTFTCYAQCPWFDAERALITYAFFRQPSDGGDAAILEGGLYVPMPFDYSELLVGKLRQVLIEWLVVA